MIGGVSGNHGILISPLVIYIRRMSGQQISYYADDRVYAYHHVCV